MGYLVDRKLVFLAGPENHPSDRSGRAKRQRGLLMMKLHLGCADKKLEGWINIDSVKEFGPDVIHDISLPLPYPDLSADEILAEGLLENFDKYVRYIVFCDWARVLKIGGKMTLQVPDFETILKKFKKFGFDNFVDFIFGENMFRSSYYIGHFGNHKFAYSKKSLSEFVKQFGVETVNVDQDSLNLTLTGVKKKHVPMDSLDNINIYAHANAHGVGKPELPLGFIREKIKVFQQLNNR